MTVKVTLSSAVGFVGENDTVGATVQSILLVALTGGASVEDELVDEDDELELVEDEDDEDDEDDEELEAESPAAGVFKEFTIVKVIESPVFARSPGAGIWLDTKFWSPQKTFDGFNTTVKCAAVNVGSADSQVWRTTFGTTAWLDVITLFPSPDTDTATNNPLPYVSATHLLVFESCEVHVMPSGLVMTPLPVPSHDTATNNPAPYVTELQLLSVAEVRDFQLMPSELVMTRSPSPDSDTATNNPAPYAMERQLLLAAEVRGVQIPAVSMTEFF